MARMIRHAKLDTPSARAKLAARKPPYWMKITQGCTLGYRKGAGGGRWLAKYVKNNLRKEATLGPADDALDADGITALDFAMAQEKARAWFAQVAREAAGEDAPLGPYTVADAARDYMTWFKSRRKSVRDTQYKVDTHILPDLGETEIAKLTTDKLSKWHHALADARARVRTTRGSDQKYRETANDPETIRKRRSTANRVLNVLKAMLSHAWTRDKVSGNKAWTRVKPFEKADAPKERYLDIGECKRLVNACDPEFRPLVQGALFTGCRYGELARMSVSDFNSDAGTVKILMSKSGKPRYVVLDGKEGQDFFEARTAGRPGDAPMFPRETGERWGAAHQRWPIKKACERANITPAIGFHILRHSYASLLVMGGAPVHVVAKNLGHSNTAILEKHYMHLAPSYVSEAIRDAAPQFGIATPGKVALLKKSGRSK